MFNTLHCNTADDLWLATAGYFQSGGIARAQSSRGGATLEVLHAALSIENPRQRWIGSREPAMSPAFALAEVIWIVTGRNDSAFLNFFNHRLPRFAGEGETYYGAYGFRLRNAFGIDQLRQAASALRNSPDNRQVVLQMWDCRLDLPDFSGKPRSADIPCNIVSMLKVRDGRLHWTQIMRSNDLFLGLPHNINQFTTIQEVLAGWIGVEVGQYYHVSDSLHLYERDEYVLGNLKRQAFPENGDEINVPEPESSEAFQELALSIEKIIDTRVESKTLLALLATTKIAQAFKNWLAILVAEGCFRRCDENAAREAVSTCQNACLAYLWHRWLDRKKAEKPCIKSFNQCA
jgi:thymidylate synthase